MYTYYQWQNTSTSIKICLGTDNLLHSKQLVYKHIIIQTLRTPNSIIRNLTLIAWTHTHIG